MQDRAHNLADRAEARQQSEPPMERTQQRQPVWHQGTGPLTEAESRRLSAGQQRAYDGRDP